jgi:hypothetical protein
MAATLGKRWSVRVFFWGWHFRALLDVTAAHFTEMDNVKVVYFEQSLTCIGLD